MKKILAPLFLCIAVIFNVSPIYAQENTSLENILKWLRDEYSDQTGDAF